MSEQIENTNLMKNNHVGPIQSPERLRAHAVAALVPFLTDGPSSDPLAGRLAAEALLDDYSAATPKELQLSTQIIALGWAAVACLRAAVAAMHLSTARVASHTERTSSVHTLKNIFL